MGLLDKLRGELIDIIEWLDDSNDTLVYRFERYGNEIKMGAQLVVREGQKAVFINEGQMADIFEPGTYTLETQNIPILSTLKGWAHGFNSPFKAEVYFISTRQFTDQKWGTSSPVPLRDPEFGPMQVRARGNYSFRVEDPALFIREIVGTDGDFTTEEIVTQLRSILLSRFTDSMAESKIPVLDMAANYDEFGQLMEKKIAPDFEAYGLSLTKFLVENITMPEAVQEALDKRASMGILGNMQQYAQFQAANAMEAAANNPAGGGAGQGMGMGMGFAMAQQMAGAFSQPQAPPQAAPGPAAAPPPPPPAASYYVAVNGQQTGPFDTNTLRQKAASGELTKESMVWKNGMAAWAAAGSVSELQTLFPQGPPPLPPQ